MVVTRCTNTTSGLTTAPHSRSKHSFAADRVEAPIKARRSSGPGSYAKAFQLRVLNCLQEVQDLLSAKSFYRDNYALAAVGTDREGLRIRVRKYARTRIAPTTSPKITLVSLRRSSPPSAAITTKTRKRGRLRLGRPHDDTASEGYAEYLEALFVLAS